MGDPLARYQPLPHTRRGLKDARLTRSRRATVDVQLWTSNTGAPERSFDRHPGRGRKRECPNRRTRELRYKGKADDTPVTRIPETPGRTVILSGRDIDVGRLAPPDAGLGQRRRRARPGQHLRRRTKAAQYSPRSACCRQRGRPGEGLAAGQRTRPRLWTSRPMEPTRTSTN